MLGSKLRSVEIISDQINLLGESPVWDKHNGYLYWADLQAQLIYRIRPGESGFKSFAFAHTLGSFGLCSTEDNSLIVAKRDGIWIFNLDSEQSRLFSLPSDEPQPHTRFNDGKISPDGDFFVGTMDERFVDNIAKLYRIDASSGSATCVADGLMVSNGLAWNAQGDIMFHSDSRQQKIWQYQYKDGQLGAKKIFAEPTDAVGRPDGGACDLDGCYWSCGVSAGKLNKFSPEGQLLEQIDLPCKSPTMPCFGGDDMRTIFITSLSHNHTQDDFLRYPGSGKVLAVKVECPGVPVSSLARLS